MRNIRHHVVGEHVLFSLAKHQKPVVLTPQSASLSEEERALYSKHKPFGFILFGKHCQSPEQLQELCAQLRDAAGDDCIISIDQEGGRVARMREPHWQNFPAATDMDDVYQTYRDLGAMLYDNGINVNFAPCLDVVPNGGKCDAIGDRCFSSDPQITGQKGIEACKGLMASNIAPVIKHMPGHGRAIEDSHFYLPAVKASAKELEQDLIPFQMLADDKNVMGMICHVIYQAWDNDNPATLSPFIIQNIIREKIGFKGLLFSDDLAMKALDNYGDIIARVKLCLDAGCDIALPCHTTMDQSRAILESLS